MLGNTQGKLLNEYIEDYVVFDLETTGVSPYNDEVIEISAVKARKGKVVEEFSQLVNPQRTIPFAASRVNNITDDMVLDAPFFDEVLRHFLEFVGEDVLVGHNIQSFDMKFIYRDCERYFHQLITNDYVDTLILAKRCFPEWRHRKLGDLADYYGISTQGAHRALADCRMNQRVFELLGKEMNTETMKTLDSNVKTCPLCNLPLKKRNGRYGEFWGCTGFPNCRYTENI
ncbi:MAG: topoisomerase DNA-binding C4 zinc finger domain-containing protein [Clostridium sp.]|nr:topoisomerase DNA-binding C4 zinc finger domain-containing protein [Clostridium sp.]